MAEILEWACKECRTKKEAEAKNYCGSVVGNSMCYYVPIQNKVRTETPLDSLLNEAFEEKG